MNKDIKEIAKEIAEIRQNQADRDMKELENKKIPDRELERFDRLYDRVEYNLKKRKMPTWSKVAVAMLAIIMATNVCIISVPAVRKQALNFWVMQNDDNTVLEISDSERAGRRDETRASNLEIGPTVEYYPTYIPKDYRAVEENKTEDYLYVEYQGKETDDIILYKQIRDDAIVSIDSEKSNVREVNINGTIGLLSTKENNKILAWRNNHYFYTITVKSLSEDELIKIAKNVVEEK